MSSEISFDFNDDCGIRVCSRISKAKIAFVGGIGLGLFGLRNRQLVNGFCGRCKYTVVAVVRQFFKNCLITSLEIISREQPSSGEMYLMFSLVFFLVTKSQIIEVDSSVKG